MRQPDVIGPSVRAHGRRVAAPIIRTIDQQAANAGDAHLAQSDFLLAHDRRLTAGVGHHRSRGDGRPSLSQDLGSPARFRPY
jgi:hypothetical protein